MDSYGQKFRSPAPVAVAIRCALLMGMEFNIRVAAFLRAGTAIEGKVCVT